MRVSEGKYLPRQNTFKYQWWLAVANEPMTSDHYNELVSQ